MDIDTLLKIMIDEAETKEELIELLESHSIKHLEAYEIINDNLSNLLAGIGYDSEEGYTINKIELNNQTKFIDCNILKYFDTYEEAIANFNNCFREILQKNLNELLHEEYDDIQDGYLDSIMTDYLKVEFDEYIKDTLKELDQIKLSEEFIEENYSIYSVHDDHEVIYSDKQISELISNYDGVPGDNIVKFEKYLDTVEDTCYKSNIISNLEQTFLKKEIFEKKTKFLDEISIGYDFKEGIDTSLEFDTFDEYYKSLEDTIGEDDIEKLKYFKNCLDNATVKNVDYKKFISGNIESEIRKKNEIDKTDLNTFNITKEDVYYECQNFIPSNTTIQDGDVSRKHHFEYPSIDR